MKEEGTILNLVDSKKQFIAKGYYGKQNKGYGWVLSTKKNEKFDVDFFAGKIKEAMTYRQSFYDDPETTAFRVLNGEGDGLGGLTIDYFEGYYLLTWYSIGIYTFKDRLF